VGERYLATARKSPLKGGARFSTTLGRHHWSGARAHHEKIPHGMALTRAGICRTLICGGTFREPQIPIGRELVGKSGAHKMFRRLLGGDQRDLGLFAPGSVAGKHWGKRRRPLALPLYEAKRLLSPLAAQEVLKRKGGRAAIFVGSAGQGAYCAPARANSVRTEEMVCSIQVSIQGIEFAMEES